MARSLIVGAGCRYAVALTGYAGPAGGDEGAPLGTIWFAACGPGGDRVERRRLGGDRKQIQEVAAGIGLDLLRRAIQAEGGR
jgi:nicotinamide mononucleotide (NMN) deamidase PncC